MQHLTFCFVMNSKRIHHVAGKKDSPLFVFSNDRQIIPTEFLSQRIAKAWNSLPTAAVDFTNSVYFGTSLQDITLRIFTRF